MWNHDVRGKLFELDEPLAKAGLRGMRSAPRRKAILEDPDDRTKVVLRCQCMDTIESWSEPQNAALRHVGRWLSDGQECHDGPGMKGLWTVRLEASSAPKTHSLNHSPPGPQDARLGFMRHARGGEDNVRGVLANLGRFRVRERVEPEVRPMQDQAAR